MDFFSILALVGGLGLFLYGMDVMGANLKKLAGGSLESILSKLTSNKLTGFLLGFVVTAVIQSSSATTVMLVGFVNSGIMRLGQTLGIIMGANVGTTVTSWILSLTGISGGSFFLKMLKPSSFTPILMIAGVVMIMACKSEKKKDIAHILIGFSVLMFGMNMMSDAMSGLKDSPAFGQMLIMFSNPIMGIITGTLLTAVIQSSSASVGILQALALTGAIPYSTAIPIILGQNIGTTITPILSAITGNTESKRVAFACLYIKIFGVLAFCAMFYGLNAVIGFDFMSTNVTVLSIATFHTLFNVFSTIVLLPFTNAIEKITIKTIPAKVKEETSAFDTLDDRFLSIPAFATEKCRELVCEMAVIAQESVADATLLLTKFDKKMLESIKEREELVDMYEDKIGTYLVKVAEANLTSQDSKIVTELQYCIGEIERISDYAYHIAKSAEELKEKKISFSESAVQEIKVIVGAVNEVMQLTVEAFEKNDMDMAHLVEPLQQVIERIKNKIRLNHVIRLQEGLCSVELGFILSDLLNALERIAGHCSNVAVCQLEISHGTFEAHEYLTQIRESDKNFSTMYESYKEKYKVASKQQANA